MIALILYKLAFIDRICLSSDDTLDLYALETATVSGFGKTSDVPDSPDSQGLKYVNVAVLTNFDCYLTVPIAFTDNNLCTSSEGKRGTCDVIYS